MHPQHTLDTDWQRFILANGWRASGHDLAAVLGQPIAEVERVRRTGACTHLSKSKSFAELFALWHGRSPTEDEWPTPRKAGVGSNYKWQAPELALLASLVGRLGNAEIAQALTARLRERTGDPRAVRTRIAVQVRINQIGMQSTDVVGGITTTEAGREIGSLAVIHQAIAKKHLCPVRVGRLWVIPHDAWMAWKSKRVFPPKDYVPLRSIREPLSVRSDKLSEFSRAGYIPTALRCNPYGTKGPSTQFGTWYIHKDVAAKLLSDRRAGRPMPWHGKPMIDNLRATFRTWHRRKHPNSCKTCAEIWGKKGAPRSFEDYALRYPPLAHGAKRHLTRRWNPGLTIQEVAAYAGCDKSRVRHAVDNGLLTTIRNGRRWYVSRTDATRWRARKCPAGDNGRSWISLNTARKQYLFTLADLRGFIASKKLKSKTGVFGAAHGVVYVSRHQCGQLRERIGFTEEQVALRIGITVPRLRKLLDGTDWRKTKGISLAAMRTVMKRLESHQGYTIEEATAALGVTAQWICGRIKDGTIKISRAKWDCRRLYITEPMLRRLKEAKRTPKKREQFNADWLRLSDAAYEAGVSVTTIIYWAENDNLDRRPSRNGWRYHRAAVRSQARRYWRSVRFHRAKRPDWLEAEHKNRHPRMGVPPERQRNMTKIGSSQYMAVAAI